MKHRSKFASDKASRDLTAPNEISDRPTVQIFIVALITLVIFSPLCRHEFTWWDDWATVHQNKWLNPPTLASLGHYWTHAAYGLYAPLTYTAWIGLAWLGHVNQPDANNISLNPWVFHSANVAVHVLSALAAFALLRRMTKRDWPACFGALLFAVHPVQIEPVGWVSGLKDVLAGCLAIVALWRFVVHAQNNKPGCPDWIPDSIGTAAFILAMLAKPSAVVVPVIAFGIDLLLIRRSFARALRSTAFWLLLAIPFLIIGRIAQDVTGIPKAPLWARPLIATDTLAFYLGKLFLPIQLAPDYGRRTAVVIARGWLYWTWIAPALFAILMLAARKRLPWLATAGWVFASALLPVLGLATFQFQFTSTVADHYVYLAMLAPAMAMAFALRTYPKHLSYIFASLVLLLLAMRSLLLTPVWEDDFTLFSHNLEVNPDSAVAHNNLGNIYKMRGEPDRALEHFRRAMALAPDFPNPFNNAAYVLAERGDVNGAIAAWERSLETRARLPRTLFPNYMEDHNRIGQILLQHGQYARAIEHFEALLAIDPNHVEAKKYLAEAREKLKDQNAKTPATQQ